MVEDLISNQGLAGNGRLLLAGSGAGGLGLLVNVDRLTEMVCVFVCMCVCVRIYNTYIVLHTYYIYYIHACMHTYAYMHAYT